MARNASGTHSLPTGNPVVTGTAISSTVHNATLSDLSTEITDSLSRSGKGGMTAPLRCADGAVSAPAHSFTSETGTGLYRAGSGDLRASILGVDRFTLTATSAALTKPLAMGTNKITGLANGTAATDAAAYGQIYSSGTITAGTDFALENTPGTGTHFCVKIGGVVFFRLTVVAATPVGSAAWTSIADMPSGFEPVSTTPHLPGTLIVAGAVHGIRASIATSGIVSVTYYDDGTSLNTPPAIAAGNIVSVAGHYFLAAP